jgi:hypothetical protein
MITFNELGKYGRLGNQLFQYAALRALSLEKGYKISLPPLDNRIWHGQKCLLNNFKIKTNSSPFKPSFTYSEPSLITFDPEFFSLPDGINLHGFFQNLKYFDKHKKIICKELILKSQYLSQAQTLLSNYQSSYPDYKLVTLHIRRGDNITVNGGFISLFGSDDTKLDPNSPWAIYFNNAKKLFGEKTKYLIFTGGNRDNNDQADLDWVTNNLGSECILASTLDPLIDYALIYLCSNNILSYVSSFGWWASYSNLDLNKTVVMPKNYFVNGQDTTRLTPKNWITI